MNCGTCLRLHDHVNAYIRAQIIWYWYYDTILSEEQQNISFYQTRRMVKYYSLYTIKAENSKCSYHYGNMSVQYAAISKSEKKFFFLDDVLYITEAVLTSTHNLCFRAKIRKNVYPCKPHFYCIKVGCKGVFITRTCYHDEDCIDDEAFLCICCCNKA